MIEYICRWCGEGYESNHELDPVEVANRHRYCVSAVVLLDSTETPEAMLEQAARRELVRPPAARA